MNKNHTQSASDFIDIIQKYPAKVLWSKTYKAEQNKLFDSFYSFCKLGDITISLHGEMNIETFHKRREKEANIARLYKCKYIETDHGLVQTSKEYIGLGADPRMVSNGANAYAYVVGYGEAKHPAFLYVEKDDSLHPIIGEEGFDWGKNWQPFLKEGRLYIVHELTPYTIYEINLKTFELESVHSNTSDFSLPAHYTNHSMFRGGANAIAENDFVTGVGRASAQPYKHLPFIWSSYKNASPVIQFVDFFNQISEKGFSIIDPTSFYKEGDTIYLGLTCSETCWFFEQQFLNILLVFDVKEDYENLLKFEDFLSSFEDVFNNKQPNLKNHLFHCDRMQHDIPYSYEYGVKSTGLQGTLIYGPYIEIKEDIYLKIELSYLTNQQEGKTAGIFDICLSKENENGKIEQLIIAECDLKTTNKEIETATLFFDTQQYQGYKVEFRVNVNKEYELNAFHIRTKKMSHVILCTSLPSTMKTDNSKGIRSSKRKKGFLFFGPYQVIKKGGEQTAILNYKSKATNTEIVGVFDFVVTSLQGNLVTLAKTEVYGTNNEWSTVELKYTLDAYVGYSFEIRFLITNKKKISVNCISLSNNNSNLDKEKFENLIVQDEPEKQAERSFFKKNIKSKIKENVLKPMGLSWKGRTSTDSFKYVFLRRVFRFCGLYPNIHMKHFYYERPNSFMAPKIYEYVQMFRGIKFNKSDVVLDLGCADGTLPFVIGKSVKKVVGVDTLHRRIQEAEFKAAELSRKMDAEFYCSRIEDIKLKEESFDKVVSFSVIEHIPNYIEVFQEIFKILKKDGELIISVDSFSHFDKKQRAIHQKNFEVEKYFKKYELHELLTNLGFREVDVEPIFKSEFSKKWFTRVMNNPGEYFGSFKRIYSFFLYFMISYYEKKVKQQEHGIFLVARCKK